MAEDASQSLFDGCAISIVRSNEIPEQTAVELQNTLTSNGADIVDLEADGRVRIDHVTHIIAASIDFPQYDAALDQMLNVVKPSWVMTSLMKNKQVPMRPFTPDPRLFFSGINITTADIPQSDKDAIIGAVVAMGGQETSNLTKVVTHIVALTVDHEKCKQALEKNLKCRIVLPHWFDDCLKLGKRIDEAPYLLPNPEILNKLVDDVVAIPNSQQLEGATGTRPTYIPTPIDTPSSSSRQLQVFKGKKIMLSEDLALSSRIRAIMEDLISSNDGFVTSAIREADIYVCQYRDGEDYVTASRAGKDVGNLAWLYHLITQNHWTSPFRRLMHYPVPRDGIPGFKDCRITLSNYGGEARIYLENLVIAAGGEFTKSMKQDNTHLITARKNSEKCKAAQEWNIDMVNHLWIEESYARCKMQSLTNPRYTHFPARTNLGEVIGQTQFDKKAVERLYYGVGRAETSASPRKVMQAKDQNIKAHQRSPDVSVDAKDNLISEMRQLKKTAQSSTPSRKPPAIGTPHSNRNAEKENVTPSTTSSRGAKDKALSRLHELTPDIALYEKEKKRAGGGVWGGIRAAKQIEKQKNESRKRTATPESTDEDSAEPTGHDHKKQKTDRVHKPQIEMRLMITGYTRWLTKQTMEAEERRKLREQGIQIVQDAKTCTHLAAPSIVRTQKFLSAIAHGPIVLSTNFIDACLERKAMPDCKNFLLKDTENEKRYNIKLKDVTTRAKQHPHKLLENVLICCTEHIANGHETYQAIVEANGGTFSIYRGRSSMAIKRSPSDQTDDEPLYLLSGRQEVEKKLWPKFDQMACNGKMIPRIVTTEWLLDTAMSQKLVWQDEYLWPREDVVS